MSLRKPSVPSPEQRARWRELVADSRMAARDGRLFTDVFDADAYPGNADVYAGLARWDEQARRAVQRLRTHPVPRAMTGEPAVRSNVPAFCRKPDGRPRTLHDLADLPGQQEAVEAAGLWVAAWHSDTKPAKGLLLAGKPGRGKTSVAAALAVDCGEPYTAAFWEVRDLLSAVKDEFGENVSHTLERAATKPLLVLDDLGRERQTDFNVDTVRGILERRYARGLPVVVTTNLTSRDLEAHVGSRVWSRLHEMTEQLPLGGSDIRIGRTA